MELKGKRVAYTTLGCKLNFSESSTIRHKMERAGTISVGDKESADIVIINTCSVTDVAERKCRQTIRKMIHRNPGAFVIIVGCYAQLRADELLEIPGVGMVLGTGDKFNIEAILNHGERSFTADPKNIFQVKHFDIACSYGDRTRCFLKIQDGCDYFCSYCTIPYARGVSRSATIDEVVEAVKFSAERGVKEIILTGVNTGDFGRQRGESFYALLQRLDKLDDIDRFRISSIEPNLLSEEIINFVANSGHFMPHFHIPLQSGSNTMLEHMKRRYRREEFADKVDYIKKRIPHAFIGVDIITGMNGEREEFFLEGYQFLESLDISQLHVFPYSERAGTKALEIPFRVSPQEKHRRVGELIALSERKLSEFYHNSFGEKRPVLFEESSNRESIAGFTDNYIRVEIPFDSAYENRIVNIILDEQTVKNQI